MQTLWEEILYACLSCKRVLPDHLFVLTATKRRGMICLECRTRANEEKFWRWHYGITRAQYEAQLARQGGVCAICK